MNEIIVSGSDALATTIVVELKSAGAQVVALDDTDAGQMEIGLEQAGIADAAAVVCAGEDDAVNLEIALLARKLNANVRVVARLANDVLREAISADNGPGAILNVAELTAPSVVKACLSDATHSFTVAGVNFVVAGSEAPRDTTLHQLYGELTPVALLHGERSPSPGVMEVRPPRDQRLHAGDWTAVIGTADEVAAFGIKVSPENLTRAPRRPLHRAADGIRALLDEFNPAFYPVLGAVVLLIIGSTVVLRFGHSDPPMGWVDALYFTVETISTTGYGDFAFVNQPTWLRLFAIMLMFGGATTVALLVAFVADVLLSRRFSFTAAGPGIRHLNQHVVVAGLSALGVRVVSDLTTAGYDVAVIERDEDNALLPVARALDIPVIFGDATQAQTLKAARVDRARALAVLTRNDMINIETGIVAAQILGRRLGPMYRKPRVPLVLRVFDRSLGFALAQRFGFVNTRSTVELAAPWFIGAAMGLQVAGTFSVGQRSFVVGGMRVAPGSELDGAPLSALSSQTQVLARSRTGEPVVVHPRRDSRLTAGDLVHLVGPYRELLSTLQKGTSPIAINGRGLLPERQP
ncbi:NAD-binding protein [Mycobacterium sp.]|uniref:NAD-binding protein n=1 Tax=Mycobacterium sp. TaxID=1785 RepID=UPI0025D68946|nr:NAD-binding protein [Mycobacterium sp.]